jgi:acetyl-CoA carboxylase carboxyltransferase component
MGATDMSADDSTERLRQLKNEALQSGGPERIFDRRRRGAGTARERVLGLLDTGTFVELDVFVPGAVTGYGKVEGREVYVFSQDGEAAPEAPDELFARKIVKVMDLAMKNGAPLIGFYDCGHARGSKAAGSLGRHAELYFRNVMASGLVPQIAAVMGPCMGGAAYSPALADFTIMVKGSSHLFLGDPAGAGSRGEGGVAVEELGGARSHSEKSGVANLAADDEAESFDMIRGLLSYLPQNNLEEPPRADLFDPVDRGDEELDSLAACDPASPCDMREVVMHVVDEGEFCEVTPWWAMNLLTGFARLGGRSVGIVGNQPTQLDGRIDSNAATKGARFVRFCDAFNLPVVTFVDTPGFEVGKEQEHGGVIRSAAKLMYAYCEATVPKLSVVTRRAFGEGFEVMSSKHVRADFNFAWPGAGIGTQTPAGALDRQDSASPFQAALAGHLDDVIEPVETRPRLIRALEACASKREGRPPKKHGNIPL